VLPSSGPHGRQQEYDCQWNHHNRQLELNVISLQNDNQELNGKAQEKEEVEFEQSDENLISQIATLHSKVCGDVLVNGPGELIVELPANYRHQDSTECEYTWDCNEKRLNIRPDSLLHNQCFSTECAQVLIGFFDLILLNGGIDEQCDVEEA